MNPAVLIEKKKNALGILNCLIDNGETSRQVLVNKLNLSPGTVTNIVTELIEKKLVLEGRQLHSTVGRKSTLLRFNADLCNIVTASIGVDASDAICLAICNLSGDILVQDMFHCDLCISETCSELTVTKNIIAIFQDFIGAQPEQLRSNLTAIGVCIGGMVQSTQTIDLPLYNWYNVNLIYPLSAALRLPVYVEGVTRIKALYEMRYIDPADRNIIYLNLSSGVGMVNFFNGKMVLGRYGIAGEVGHISLDIHGPQCFCGNRGCFEQYCGMNNILSRLPGLINDENDVLYDMMVRKNAPVTPKLLFAAHRQGSLEVHRLLSDVSEYLGAGLVAIINTYDPDRIIIAGYLRGEDDFLIDRAISYARSRIVKRFDRNISIARANLADDNQHLPISAFVLKHLLESYL